MEKGISFSRMEVTTEDNSTPMRSTGWESTAGKMKNSTKVNGSTTRCQEKAD